LLAEARALGAHRAAVGAVDAGGALWWQRIPIAVAAATIMMTSSTTVLTSAAVMTAAVTAHEPFQETHHSS